MYCSLLYGLLMSFDTSSDSDDIALSYSVLCTVAFLELVHCISTLMCEYCHRII